MQSLRIVIFALVIVFIHMSARRRESAAQGSALSDQSRQVLKNFSGGGTLGQPIADSGLIPVLDDNDEVSKFLATTSPDADHIIGFSGPTNVMVAFDLDMRVTNLKVAWSRDTREHLAEVVDDAAFWKQFMGLKWEDLASKNDIDAVSGATLTSLAIGESLITRFGGELPSLRFPEPLQVADVQPIFSKAASLEPSPLDPHAWDVYDKDQRPIGFVLSSSPVSDDVIGYQGPTRTLIALLPNGKVQRIHVSRSYDNQPYVSYLNDDWSWPELFKGLSLQELADYSLKEQGIEGVSGATFTSMAVAKGVIKRAQQAIEPAPEMKVNRQQLQLTSRDWGTISVILIGVFLGMTHLRGIGWLRVSYQLILIVYVGVINGDLLSQAMFVGWSQHGIPWRSAISLVVIAGIAFLFPVVTKKNIYCSHLCAHGAVQQLLRNRVRLQFHPGQNLKKFLGLIPVGLLIWVVVVSVCGLACSLVDIEPFDAYLFRISGWSAITIAIIGIIASLLTPMAYCRFGCPTGTILEYLRRTRRSDRISPADGIAVLLLILSAGLYFLPA